MSLQDLAESHSVFSTVASAWSLERDGSINDTAESPEVLLEEEYREQFPDHGQDFHSLLSTIEMEDSFDQAEVEQPEITDEDIEKARVHLDSVRALVADDSISFSIAVKRYSNEDVQSYNNDGRMVNPATGNTFFEIGDLDPDIYFTIDTMEVGTISAPFEYQSPLGEPMLRIVQLQSRTAPHRASLEQDYSKIQKAAIESKKNEYISTWIESRVDATFVNIDGMYDGCPNLSKWRKNEVRP